MTTEEKMLKAWIYMGANISEEKLLTGITYEEMMVMNTLSVRNLTSKEILERVNLPDNDIDSLIDKMEKEGLVEKISAGSTTIIKKTDSSMQYEIEHQKLLLLMKRVSDVLGDEDANKFAELINKITDVAKDSIN